MKSISAKNLVASAIVFCFSNFTIPLAGVPQEVKTQEEFQETQTELAMQAIQNVDIGVGRIVNISKSRGPPSAVSPGNKVTIHSVNVLPLEVSLPFCQYMVKPDLVVAMNEPYRDTPGGYVNLAPTDLETGRVSIIRGKTALERNVSELLLNPESFFVSPIVVLCDLSPKIITDSQNKTALLLMQPHDFRLTSEPKYTENSLKQLLFTTYATFRGYTQICQKENTPTIIHTSFWGTNYGNNARMTTAIQTIAATLSGVDRLVFHIDSSHPIDQLILFDAQDICAKLKGNSVETILQNLLQQSDLIEWSASSTIKQEP